MQPHYGVGSKFARTRWEERGAPDSFWTVTKLKPKASGRAGKAWGTLTWKGEEKGVEQHPQGDDQGDLESDRGRDATGRTGAHPPARPGGVVRGDVDAAPKMRDGDVGTTARRNEKATRKGVA